METPSACWDKWVGEALATLHSLKVLRSVRPICLRNSQPLQFGVDDGAFQVFDEMQQWDRSSVEVEIAETTFSRWMHDTPSSGTLYSSAMFGLKKLLMYLFFMISLITIGKLESRVIHQSGIEVTPSIYFLKF